MVDRETLGNGWIDAEAQKPPHGKVVHCFGRSDTGRRIDIVGWYLQAQREECACDTAFTDCVCEYDEQRDAFFYPPGWYEQVINWGDFSCIAVCEHEVTHWRELVEPPV